MQTLSGLLPVIAIIFVALLILYAAMRMLKTNKGEDKKDIEHNTEDEENIVDKPKNDTDAVEKIKR
jgi:cell division protein FtsL